MTAFPALTVRVHKELAHFLLDVDITCRAGDITAFVGPSGAGKTTLIRIIAGLEQPDSGVVSLGEQCWADSEAGIFLPARKRKLGFVFQEYTLFPHLTIWHNVAFAATRKERVTELLRLFGIAHLAEKRPSGISGGERQRAAFCQALARDPVLLLLDEPFSALDAATRRNLRAELYDLKSALNIPVLHVTHDLEEARFLGDSIIALDQGHVCPRWFYNQVQCQYPTHVTATQWEKRI